MKSRKTSVSLESRGVVRKMYHHKLTACRSEYLKSYGDSELQKFSNFPTEPVYKVQSVLIAPSAPHSHYRMHVNYFKGIIDLQRHPH